MASVRFGANTLIWADHFGPEEFYLLRSLKEAGFDGVELPLFDSPVQTASGLRRELAKSGLASTFCAICPSGLNTTSEDSGVRAKTLAHWKDCVRMIADVGGELLVGPLYAPVGYLPGRRRTDDEWRWAVEVFQELSPVLDECGVSVALEPLNRYETYFLNTVQDGVNLCGDIGHSKVGILVDTYHANIEEKSVARAIETAGQYLRHVHTCENDRGVPGTGHVPWAEVFAALRRVAYEGWLTIEGFGFSLGAVSAAASIWRDLADKPELIAFEGVKFLRGASV